LSQDHRGVECNESAIFEDSNHNIWFGTQKGLMKYDPTQEKKNNSTPTVRINKLKLFFEDVDWLSYSDKLTKWNNLPEDLVLKYKQNHLTFEFSALNLSANENIEYQFILEPFDKEWYQPTTKKTVSYSNLSPGAYTFRVKARNLNGEWNPHPTTYSFTITKPWFKEWWFILLVIVVVFYSIYQVSSFKEKQQRKISKLLESKVKQRTAIIESQKDEKDILLKEKEVLINDKDLLLKDKDELLIDKDELLKDKDELLIDKDILLKEIHHRVKNNMQVIISLISIQSSYTKDDDALSLFEEAKNRIHSMALIHEKMYLTGDLTSIDIQDYITDLTNDLIRTYTINCEIFLDINIYKSMFIIDTLIPLGLLLNEIISNALKYAFIGAENGRMVIHLSFDPEANIYTLLVGDNGIGMPLELLETEDGTLGLELVKIFVEQLDGEIQRLATKGTMFEIKFPPRDF
jgi:two-component sensor histidine kinase